MLRADPVMDTDQPRLEIGEDEMDDRQMGAFRRHGSVRRRPAREPSRSRSASIHRDSPGERSAGLGARRG